ncbi:MAG: heparinase II/III family protein, partial [Akkermansiaceae bacterium]|nr:heparinase II/III family protein [Verrucomicrobiales bacterium]
NTVTIDQRDPFAYISTWVFGSQQKGNIVALREGPGWQAAASEQENFAPAIHRRMVILLNEPPALVVVDAFEKLEPAQTVQLWFHLDSTKVTLDAKTGSAETNDPALANLKVIGYPGLQLAAHPGRVSVKLDIAHPSTRVCFSDQGGPARRVYLTRLIPRAASASAWPSVEPTIEPSTCPFPTIRIGKLCVVLP